MLRKETSRRREKRQPPNARGSADCGWTQLASLYANFASKKYLKNRAVAIRLQRLLGGFYGLTPRPILPSSSPYD